MMTISLIMYYKRRSIFFFRRVTFDTLLSTVSSGFRDFNRHKPRQGDFTAVMLPLPKLNARTYFTRTGGIPTELHTSLRLFIIKRYA